MLRSREFPSVAVLKAEGKISFVLCLVHLFTPNDQIDEKLQAGAVGKKIKISCGWDTVIDGIFTIVKEHLVFSF